MKILLLDIETAPNIAYVWGLFKENIPLARLVDSGYVLCFAAKWLGDDAVIFDSVEHAGEKRMLDKIHKLLCEADVVIHYNGARFDIPTLNKEFVQAEMLPPSTYKQIDLLKVVRKEFRFPSAKLDYVAKALKVGAKVRHAGFELWVDCMNDDPDAWVQMQEYNVNDVLILENLYDKLLPWIRNHPNIGLYEGKQHICPNCGSAHLERRGFAYTNLSKFQRFQCKDCGTWSRDKTNLAEKALLAGDRG